MHRDPADPRIFVPKPGGGLSLNFGHRLAWWLFVAMTVIPLVVVVTVLVVYLG